MSPRRRLLLTAVAAVAVLLAAAAAVRLLAAGPGGRSGGDRPDQARPGPVLLVPGYGGGRAALQSLADRLTGAGRTARVVPLPGDGTGDLRAQAGALDAAVRTALDGGAASVDVVGYSAGGVVTRLWVDRYDGAAVARRVVSLGAPLRGAALAGAGTAVAPDACPTACRQLAPGSALLTGLAGPLPAGLPWLSVWTTDDRTVRPPESARLDGAVNVPVQRLCPGARIAHGELPTDPVVTALVLDALGTAPLTAPARCPV